MAKITMREAISQALMEEMDRDPAVFILGEEVHQVDHAVTKGFYDNGPDRTRTRRRENAIIGRRWRSHGGQRPSRN
jgi:pyruvate dehydrogenase E1 component beta subunit